jgi:hypothetical protein
LTVHAVHISHKRGLKTERVFGQNVEFSVTVMGSRQKVIASKSEIKLKQAPAAAITMIHDPVFCFFSLDNSTRDHSITTWTRRGGGVQ